MSELVYLALERVGRLIRKENGNLQFRYDLEYAGPPISQALPVRPEAHPHAVCRAVFGGLLLEGESRAVIARNFGVSVGNDYALLEELGGDCAGAVTLMAPGDRPPDEPRTRTLSLEELDRTLRELPARPLAADPGAGTRLSLAGAQPKLPVVIEGDELFLPLNAAAATTHIVKPEPIRFPGLVDNEAFCMHLARSCGLPWRRWPSASPVPAWPTCWSIATTATSPASPSGGFIRRTCAKPWVIPRTASIRTKAVLR